MDIRESVAQNTGRNRERQWCAELSMFLGRLKQAMRSLEDRPFRVDQHRQPPLASGDSTLNLLSERRRIVAQVRRKVPKNQDFLGLQDSRSRCDDLLTTGVDNADWAGL
jgi:hypothetical protein